MISNANALSQLFAALLSILAGIACGIIWRALSFKVPILLRGAIDILLIAAFTLNYLLLTQFYLNGKIEFVLVALFVLFALLTNKWLKRLTAFLKDKYPRKPRVAKD